MIEEEVKRRLMSLQKEKITSHSFYLKLQQMKKNASNKMVFEEISQIEKDVYDVLRKYTEVDVKPARLKVSLYVIFTVLFGFTFSLKLLLRISSKIDSSQIKKIRNKDEVRKILDYEEKREELLLKHIDSKGLHYISSIVLGLNDSIVEITAALAGFTLAIQVSTTIALMGLITGSAASLSISASEYLSKREETTRAEAIKSSIYTGVAYALGVAFLILPYFLINNPFINLGILFAVAITIIFLFNFYISIAKDQPLRRRFLEMVIISMGIALISFGIGFLVRRYLGLQV